jgi:hypothetical protein
MRRPSGAIWDPPEVVSWVVFNAFAGGVVITGYLLTAGKLTVESQVAGANVAVAGLLLSGVANAHWLLRGWRRIRMLTERVVQDERRGDERPCGNA